MLGKDFPGLTITSVSEDAANRVADSKHKSGDAVDLSLNNKAGQEFYEFIKSNPNAAQWAKANNVQVIVHSTKDSVKHIHIEREDKNPGIII